ncbi:glycine zipper 2TM domain-containing protein [Novosphingobium sp. M1R2S20]|uniref:17 kDa surface antigen n=1 Tax=Novosphingobium rhizovicinum TaxID=3228928 RepID=A0ABV3RDP2_9SPHN
MRKAVTAAILAAVAVPVMTATPAEARRHDDRRYHSTDNGIRYWRGDNGRYYCKKSNGTTGLLIGGVAGALVGRTIDGGRDKTVGTVLGAAGGALLGREIERSGSRPRCR